MLIKKVVLEKALNKDIKPVYLLFGPDEFLINESLQLIKTHWLKCFDSDKQSLTVQNLSDWQALFDEANSFGLFSEASLLEVAYDKKSLDKASEKALQAYLSTPNTQTLILIKAPQLTLKSLQGLVHHPHIGVVQITSLTLAEQKKWIENALFQLNIANTKALAQSIFHYTEGNLLASSQAIQRLSLFSAEALTQLTEEEILAQLIDQRDFNHFQLVEFLLKGELTSALCIIEKAIEARDEGLLILWYLAQTLRQLVGLEFHQHQKTVPNLEALNIWRSRLPLYEIALKRLSRNQLYRLIGLCHQADMALKSGPAHAAQILMHIAMGLCQKEAYPS